MAFFSRVAVLFASLLATTAAASAGGLKVSGGRAYERPDESLREAFFDALESEEDGTQALSAKVSKGYSQTAANYVVKALVKEDSHKAPAGSLKASNGKTYERPDESFRMDFFDALDDEEEMQDSHKAPAGGLKASNGKPYERPDESFRAAFFESLENEEEMQVPSEKSPQGYNQRAAKKVVKDSTVPAVGLKDSNGKSYERPDESFRMAFFDALENEEDTQALSEKSPQGYTQRAAKKVIKAPTGGLKASREKSYERPDESFRADLFDALADEEEMEAPTEKSPKVYGQKAAKYVVKAVVGASI